MLIRYVFAQCLPALAFALASALQYVMLRFPARPVRGWPWPGYVWQRGHVLIDGYWASLIPETKQLHFWLEHMDPARLALLVQTRLRRDRSWFFEELMGEGVSLPWETAPLWQKRRIEEWILKQMERNLDEFFEELCRYAARHVDLAALSRLAWQQSPQASLTYAQLLDWQRPRWFGFIGVATLLVLLMLGIHDARLRLAVDFLAMCLPWLTIGFMYRLSEAEQIRRVEALRSWLMAGPLSAPRLLACVAEQSPEALERALHLLVDKMCVPERWMTWLPERYRPLWSDAWCTAVQLRLWPWMLGIMDDADWQRLWTRWLDASLPKAEDVHQRVTGTEGGWLSLLRPVIGLPWIPVAIFLTFLLAQ